MKFAGKWMELEKVILSEGTQTQKNNDWCLVEKSLERLHPATGKRMQTHSQTLGGA